MNMKLVNIGRISYDSNSKGYLVCLESYEDKKFLEIIVGTEDAKQISLAKEGVMLPRPSTHNLLLNIIDSFDIKFKKIIITDYRLSTFFAKIIFYNINLGEISVDSRPSDAIVLSLQSNCPIYVNDIIFNKTISKSEQTVELSDPSNKTAVISDNQSILDNLNAALSDAIGKEEYEVAAKLRDKINDLSKK